MPQFSFSVQQFERATHRKSTPRLPANSGECRGSHGLPQVLPAHVCEHHYSFGRSVFHKLRRCQQFIAWQQRKQFRYIHWGVRRRIGILRIGLFRFGERFRISSSGSGGSGSGSGGSGSGGSGSGSSAAPAFGQGTGAAGQNTAAQFLYAAETPAGIPFATKINQQNGMLTAVSSAPVSNATNPLMQAIDPTGTYLYETSQNGILAYTINRQTGALTEMTGSPFNGTQSFVSITVDPKGKFVYATGATGVWGYSIQAGGQLAPIAGSPFPTATPGSQFGVYNSLAVDENDKFLYVTASPGIFAFNIDPNTGALTTIAGSPFKAGNAPLSLVITPSNEFLYETNNTDPTTHGYSIDQNTGVLTEISGSPFTTGSGNQPIADNMTIAVQGKFLYIANRGTFSVDANTGALAQTSSFQPGDWTVVDPTGNFLWAITMDQNCWHCDIGASAYTVDPNTGNLTLVPNSFVVMNNSFSGAVVSLAITK